jgi:cell division septation protein DedD
MAGTHQRDDGRRPPGHREPVLFGRQAGPEIVAGRHEDDEVLLDEPETDEDKTGRRGRFLPVLLALLSLAAFGGIVWTAYTWGIGAVGPEELPVIRAEAEPEKVRPESVGGLEIPHQDKMVLNEVTPDPEKPQVERLLPPPETPKPPKALGDPQAEQPGPDAQTAGQSAAGAGTETAITPEAPAIVETSGISEVVAKADTASKPEPPKAVAAPGAPKSEPQPKPAAPSTAGEPKTQTAAVPAGGAFVVQLASLKDRVRVDSEWARLQKAHPGLLGKRQLAVQTVDLGSRGTFYRMQAGFFADRAAADRVCAGLKAKKQDCIVLRR